MSPCTPLAENGQRLQIVGRHGGMPVRARLRPQRGAAGARRDSFQQRARRAPPVRVRGRQRGVSARRARSIPRFVMAYWGEAMTYHQTLWRNENVAAGAAGAGAPRADACRAARQGADAAGAGAGSTRSSACSARATPTTRRRAATPTRWAGSTRASPDDPDVASFYALALLGTMSRSLIGYADAHEGHSQALAGSDTQAQVAEILDARAAIAPRAPRRAALPAAQPRRSRARARCALPAARTLARLAPDVEPHAAHAGAHLPPARALAGRRALGSRGVRGVRGVGRAQAPRSRRCATTTRSRGCSTSCCSSGRYRDARADHRRARADRQGERPADAAERPVVDARALRDRDRRLGADGEREQLRQRQRAVRDRHQRRTRRRRRARGARAAGAGRARAGSARRRSAAGDRDHGARGRGGRSRTRPGAADEAVRMLRDGGAAGVAAAGAARPAGADQAGAGAARRGAARARPRRARRSPFFEQALRAQSQSLADRCSGSRAPRPPPAMSPVRAGTTPRCSPTSTSADADLPLAREARAALDEPASTSPAVAPAARAAASPRHW